MLDRILRAGENRQVKQHHRTVAAVNDAGDRVARLTDEELRAAVTQMRHRARTGTPLDELQVEAFAVAREAAWRVLGQRPYDVQVFGAAVLHAGGIAEMRTGEGKTLTSVLPVLLNALAGRGVHVVTVNGYLAERDAQWMGAVHRFLGLEVGVTLPGATQEEKRAAYACDITYGTASEFGFDHLRDNMATTVDGQVQRGRYMALIDEVDSILIDEARTPLIISGVDAAPVDLYRTFATEVAPHLSRGRDSTRPGEEDGDYLVDEARRTIALTSQGIAKAERILRVRNLFETENSILVHQLQNALKARELYRRDREYVVADGEVHIVDGNTGRVLPGRRYAEGIHQAIEAKEGVNVNDETRTLATVTLQNQSRGYEKLAGMTGTAKTEEAEFAAIYGLNVTVVPPNRPVIRVDHPDVIYRTEAAKLAAVVDEIAAAHESGRPVLAGTTSVEASERLSTLLKDRDIPHEVLNAKNHAREADIIAQAGRLGAVTVATNMAGRGTDILLGGNPAQMAQSDAAQLDPDIDPEDRERSARAAEKRFAAAAEKEGEKIRALGGLLVIGTERHESRRIDDQLRGRAGRQGDPGASRFYLSLEDDLMRLFNSAAVAHIMERLRVPDDAPIEAGMVTKAVSNAQRQVESVNFDQRKDVLKYDDVLEEQRKNVYSQRQRLLEGGPDLVLGNVRRHIEETAAEIVAAHCPTGRVPEDWDLEGLQQTLSTINRGSRSIPHVDPETADVATLVAYVASELLAARADRSAPDAGTQAADERQLIIDVIDRKWQDHLNEMEALRDGIGLRAVGMREPLTEYQREAHAALTRMFREARHEIVARLLASGASEQPLEPADR